MTWQLYLSCDPYPERMPKAIVHVGTHKTGTTTFQRWAHANKSAIKDATGYRFFEGMFSSDRYTGQFTSDPSNFAHIEFALMCLRPERKFVGHQRWHDIGQHPDFALRFFEHLAEELNGDDLIISNEELSFIRFPDEVDQLRELLTGYDLEFIAARRNTDDFLRSYSKWMKLRSYEPSSDPHSRFYIEPDSWILDFDSLNALFPALTWVDYDVAMEECGSIIPALIEGMGFQVDALPDWEVPPLNVSSDRLHRRFNRLRWQLRR
ncbi:unannotated protein [freshwater metagenome]|uniref:Unannotated protein n=1 Tax=freshwater metagenome TaxID=449393 RepID=A0A6J7KX19_9ZZZZ